MSFSVSKVRGRWFLGDFLGVITSSSYFHCSEPSCPFNYCLQKTVYGSHVSYTVLHEVCSQHCHEMKGLSRHQTKAIIKRQLKVIKNGRDEGGALQKKHAEWNEDARKNGEALKKKLIGEAATVQYAVDHPKMSGRQVVEKTHTKMSKYAVDMARMRQMENEGNVSDLENIISTKNITSWQTTRRRKSSYSATTRPYSASPQHPCSMPTVHSGVSSSASSSSTFSTRRWKTTFPCRSSSAL